MSLGNNLGYFLFPFPVNALFTKPLHNFSEHQKQLGSLISEIMAIEW